MTCRNPWTLFSRILACFVLALAGSQAIAGAGISSGAWTSIGPDNAPGRISTIAIHPTQTNKMWVGAPGGGIWKSTDCGASGFDCRTPTGGFTLWEASSELRFAITGPLSVATFCDASDVSPQETDFRWNHLHLSCGAGGRYDTPVGPIRLDVGYRIPGMQVIGGLTPDEREPKTFAFGIPIAVHIGIGEAY